MKAIVLGSQPLVQAIQARIDAIMGYPLPGIDIGGGVHAPPAASQTVRRVDWIKHPTLAQWALPVDGLDTIAPQLQLADRTAIQAALSGVDLTADWLTHTVTPP